MYFPHLKNEKKLFNLGYNTIAGMDESGRGSLAGPVVAGLVVVDKNIKSLNPKHQPLIKDSKLLHPEDRVFAFQYINENFYWSVGVINNKTIERIGIQKSTQLAMDAALSSLKQKPDYILTDGGKFTFTIPYKNIVDGDYLVFSIAAASIVAKVIRDEVLRQHHFLLPEYGLMFHKGYGTKRHYRSIKKYGISYFHRKSFRLI